MVNIKKIGDKQEILSRKKEKASRGKYKDAFLMKTEEELELWFKKHFSSLSPDVSEGLLLLVKVLWANAETTPNYKKD